MRTNRHNAFTLLEVVLAITLIVGLLGGAMGFYRHVAKVRDNVLADAAFSRTVRLVMDRMTAELRSLRVDPALQGRLVWTDEQIQFTTVTLPSAAAWAVADRSKEPIPPTHDMRLLTYSLQITEDEEGELINLGLQRVAMAVLALPPVAVDEDVEMGTTDLLAEPIKFVRFRYYAGNIGVEIGADGSIPDDAWVDVWGRPQPPEAVEITLGATPKDEDTDVDEYLQAYETFRRVVFLSAS